MNSLETFGLTAIIAVIVIALFGFGIHIGYIYKEHEVKNELEYWRAGHKDEYMEKVRIKTFNPGIKDEELWK